MAMQRAGLSITVKLSGITFLFFFSLPLQSKKRVKFDRSWLGFIVTHLWKHGLYPLWLSLSRSWSSAASTGCWIKLRVRDAEKRLHFLILRQCVRVFTHDAERCNSRPLSLSPLLQLHSVCASRCHHGCHYGAPPRMRTRARARA